MFEMNCKVKKLIIVCDEKTKPYANYLMALISSNDDKDGEIIGVKDGSVEAVVWSEKEFENNEPILSSNSHILFLGNSKIAKSQRSGLEIKYNMFGMNYGWLGKRAVMFVDNVIAGIDEYNEFYNYALSYHENITKLIEKKLTSKEDKQDSELEVLNDEKKEKKIKNGLMALAAVGLAINPITHVAAAAVTGTAVIATSVAYEKKKQEIIKQQYNVLALVLYLEGLSEFLEG